MLCHVRPNSHFLRKGLTRSMLDVIMEKPITSKAKKTESEVSSTKLWRYVLKKEPTVGRFGRNKKCIR